MLAEGKASGKKDTKDGCGKEEQLKMGGRDSIGKGIHQPYKQGNIFPKRRKKIAGTLDLWAGFQVALVGKEPASNAGYPRDVGLQRYSWRRK